jgi:23S rRNA (cytosine1962-C5)-methyltransferase
MQKTDFPRITVKPNILATIGRRHPWIFSRGIKHKETLREGDIVRVYSTDGHYLATGHYHDSSIAVRILSFEDMPIDQDFWDKQLSACLKRRKLLELPNDPTNAFRLVHGEGDNLSGLIIDVYDQVIVIQCHTIGMHRSIGQFAQSLIRLLGDQIVIFNKSGNTLPPGYAKNNPDGFLHGNKTPVIIKENNHLFSVDFIEGQKTGFFLDQRENRKLLGTFAPGKKVLNLYSYTGGFSIYALNNHADMVCSVDASAKAITSLEKNLALNHIDLFKHQSITGDVKKVLQEIPDHEYDIIVVDPPAFAKSQFKSHNAVQAYKRINSKAISKVKSGGLLFTFSCSQVIDQVLFQHTITAAAIESGRDARILYILSQAADHPVSIFHPEGKYLKGLVLQVE